MADNSGLDAIIQDQIQQTVPQMITDALSSQTHNGIDGQSIQGQFISQAPQPAIVSASIGSISTGGSAVLSTVDATILNNALARIAALESVLQALGLLN